MQIDPAEPLPHQPMPIYELQHLVVTNDGGGRALLEEREHVRAARHLPAGAFPLDERMPQYQALGEPRGQAGIASAAVIDPDRGIDQDHRRARRDRRRRGGVAIGNCPPRSASRWALARAIRASRPAWISAVFSSTPVSSRARAILSSSRLRVVRICINYT